MSTYGTRQAEFGHLGAFGQAEIIGANYAEAQMMNTARGMAVVTVTGSGLQVTRAMLDNEIRASRASRPAAAVQPITYHQFSSPSFRW